LQFAGVLDQNHALVELGDFREQRIGERRLPRAGAARDQQIAPVTHGLAQRVRLDWRDNAVGVVNPDGSLRLDRLGDGRIDTGKRFESAEVERIIWLVARFVRADKGPIQ